MATLPEASDLLKELTTALHPATLQEERALLAFARNASGQSAMQLAWWDRPYWAERMKEARFGVRADELSEYLPLNRVLDGLFKV
jgi:oligopeptidase A